MRNVGRKLLGSILGFIEGYLFNSVLGGIIEHASADRDVYACIRVAVNCPKGEAAGKASTANFSVQLTTLLCGNELDAIQAIIGFEVKGNIAEENATRTTNTSPGP